MRLTCGDLRDHIEAYETHERLGKFSFNGRKGLFQHYLPDADTKTR
jgi:hypothetical protein